jgi:CDGSH-type Zn-finger protein
MDEVVIQVRENGPYKISGPITIMDAEGREVALPEGSAIALCRCGHSANKPFCDASHKRIGFIADDSTARVTDA